ncbi:MAG: hypothetical protein QOG62_130 [Thermoleophilaceae bacterium]|nr:hypothetical protein [Thermoleophilaceae bacterium]
MTLFRVIRIYSAIEAVVFGTLLVFAIGGLDRDVVHYLGWTHGVAFLGLAAVMYIGCVRKALPWSVLATAVLLTPIGSTVHIELLRHRGFSPAG